MSSDAWLLWAQVRLGALAFCGAPLPCQAVDFSVPRFCAAGSRRDTGPRGPGGLRPKAVHLEPLLGLKGSQWLQAGSSGPLSEKALRKPNSPCRPCAPAPAGRSSELSGQGHGLGSGWEGLGRELSCSDPIFPLSSV